MRFNLQVTLRDGRHCTLGGSAEDDIDTAAAFFWNWRNNPPSMRVALSGPTDKFEFAYGDVATASLKVES